MIIETVFCVCNEFYLACIGNIPVSGCLGWYRGRILWSVLFKTGEFS